MEQRSRWSWRRRVAVTAGVLVIALLAFVGVVTGLEVWENRRFVNAHKEVTVFRSGPFRAIDYLQPYFARLPRIQPGAKEGIRFVAKPSLDEVTYSAALQLLPTAGRATGVLFIDIEPIDQAPRRHVYRCSMPSDAYISMRERLSERLRDFAGNDEMGTDGTDIALERILDGEVTSGSGNFIEPYRGIAEIVLARLRDSCRGAPLPEIGEDWYGCGNSDPVRCSIGRPSQRVTTSLSRPD